MLISNKRQQRFNLRRLLQISAVLVLSVLAFIFFIYPFYLKVSTSSNEDIILCDAEQVFNNQFISNGQTFSSGASQSDDYAHSGKYTSKLVKADAAQFGFGYDFSNVQPGEIYKASVWMKKKGSTHAALVFSGVEDSKFYQAVSKPGKVENGFSELSMIVQVPKFYQKGKAKAYVYSNGKADVYFDNLRIEKLDELPDSISKYHFDPSYVNLQIKDKNYKKLKDKVEEAKRKGVLITDEDSWVKANFIESEQKIPVKLRLKGDWLDHIKNEKWSFRIQTRDANTWNRMVTFSVQTPAARYFALEWLLHQFWEKEDVLTTRYEFINLAINGKILGTYAYEEHFEKQLLEYRDRREGPILRLSEDAMWDSRSRDIQIGAGSDIPPAEAKVSNAEVKPFKASKTAKSESLAKQYAIAQNLLVQYRDGLKTADEIFDMDQMAKYNAIIDLFGSHHGLIWHNQRFYYNPVTSLLEPIGYDGFSGQPRHDPLVLGKALLENDRAYNNGPLASLFNNEVFIEKYMAYLLKYTDEDYLSSFLNEMKEGMTARTNFLRTEFPEFYYKPDRIKNRARMIRYRLLPYKEHSVKANWKKQENDSLALLLSSTHELPLQVVGTGPSSNRMNYNFEKPLHMAAFRMGNLKVERSTKAPNNSKYIFYKPYGIDTLFSSQIGLFPAPADFVPKQAIFKNINPVSNDLYSVEGQQIVFKKGNYTTSKDIIIPKGYQVIFQAGVTLDLTKKAKFISQSPVFLNGTSEESIQIFSSDKTANGFTVLQSPELSKISFARFKDFNTMNDRGWTLTGAVTFYESDVHILNTTIIDNHCEDALNIVRSKFDINALTLINSAFDGFDADFCTGRLSNSIIRNPGNDGIDFSGSKILVTDCQIFGAGDKGISAGEESKITVERTTIDGAAIGAASKDLSYLRVKHLQLKNCTQGFAAYQKKPEYGRSTIFVESYGAENVKYLHTIAPRCTLELRGQVIVGE